MPKTLLLLQNRIRNTVFRMILKQGSHALNRILLEAYHSLYLLLMNLMYTICKNKSSLLELNLHG